jgi:phage gpG-like protein
VVTLNYELDSSDDANKIFLDFIDLLRLDPPIYKKLQNELGRGLRDQVNLRFKDQASPDGIPWIQSWRAKVQGGNTLRDTGVLNNSMTYSISGDNIDIGPANVEYAPYLHYGANIKPVAGNFLKFKNPATGGNVFSRGVVLPARPFLGFGASDKAAVSDIIETFMNELR